MTTTELIKILQDNEMGAISLKPREISLTINGRYMPNPQITLSSTGDGICGAEIDLDVFGEWQYECDDLKELKSCPLCGEDADIEEIINPLVYWDSALRGEHSHTVFCYECGLSIKADNRKEAIDKWNALPRIIRESEDT